MTCKCARLNECKIFGNVLHWILVGEGLMKSGRTSSSCLEETGLLECHRERAKWRFYGDPKKKSRRFDADVLKSFKYLQRWV